MNMYVYLANLTFWMCFVIFSNSASDYKHFVIYRKFLFCRGFLNSGLLPIVNISLLNMSDHYII